MSAAAAQLDPMVWAEAYERVENHLLAYRVTNRFLLTQLTQEILAAAADRHAREPDRDPGDLAAEEAEKSLDAWVVHLTSSTDESPTHRAARGRAAIYLAELPQRWPASFLDTQSPPPALVEELRTVYLKAGPDLEFSNMAPRPIDLGPVSGAAGETWRTFAKWPVLRGVTVWGLLAILLATAFYLTRL
ncbi:MAG TPA: hypothetical protein VG838_15480 [Opitutaceae bacterium]|nr:hypothetical protein [Opitutaceae bacterium]